MNYGQSTLYLGPSVNASVKPVVLYLCVFFDILTFKHEYGVLKNHGTVVI